MAKKIKISEACVITRDDKKQLTLVGKAKEALTTFQKNKIDVTICLDKTPKEDAEKFLKENNVPYKILTDSQDSGDEKYDAVIIPDNNTVLLKSDWDWTLSQVVDKLYDDADKPLPKSEQQKMDEKFKDYKHWADEANAARKKRREDQPVAG